MLERSHSPPPSITGTMWSASQRDLRERVRRPQWLRSDRRPVPREKRSFRAAAMVSTPQSAQMPRSRSKTFSRRYAGCVRSFHSWTQNSEQKVNRPRGTSRAHQRQRPRPFGPRGTHLRSTQPPFMARIVLTDLFLNEGLPWWGRNREGSTKIGTLPVCGTEWQRWKDCMHQNRAWAPRSR